MRSTCSPRHTFCLHGPESTGTGAIGARARAATSVSMSSRARAEAGSPSASAIRASSRPGRRLTPTGAPMARKPGRAPLTRVNNGAGAPVS